LSLTKDPQKNLILAEFLVRREIFEDYTLRLSLAQCFPTLFPAAHQHCAYSLSPLSNTPDSTHQLIIRWVYMSRWVKSGVFD